MSISTKLTTPNGIEYTQPTGLFINGEIVPARSGKVFEVIDPATENIITSVHEANEEDVELAIQAAENAFENWSTLPPDERGHYLYKLADLIDQNAELFAAVETWDNGKSLSLARMNVTAVAKVFRNYAGWADKFFGDVIETDVDHFNYTRREPVGVCGMIIPWNFPLIQVAWKGAPALAAGCTFVIKTSEATPLSALLLTKLINEAGIPKGVFNIVSGFGSTGAVIANHPRLAKVSFTGSTGVGRKVMEAAAKSNIKNITLELGGKSANIVFDDADLELSVQNSLNAIFANAGSVCVAGSRLLLQSGIHDKFLDLLVAKTKELKVGNPFEDDTYYGPQTTREQLDKTLEYIEHGHRENGRLLTGGKRIGTKGFYVEPTIFADVKNHHVIAKEEIFGPVLSVIKFDTVEEAIQIANETEFGLSAGVHTTNLNRAIYVSNKLQAGTIWVNTYHDYHTQVPFGGYGSSGIGRDLGKEALHHYTEHKSVRIGGISNGSKL